MAAITQDLYAAGKDPNVMGQLQGAIAANAPKEEEQALTSELNGMLQTMGLAEKKAWLRRRLQRLFFLRSGVGGSGGSGSVGGGSFLPLRGEVLRISCEALELCGAQARQGDIELRHLLRPGHRLPRPRQRRELAPRTERAQRAHGASL